MFTDIRLGPFPRRVAKSVIHHPLAGGQILLHRPHRQRGPERGSWATPDIIPSHPFSQAGNTCSTTYTGSADLSGSWATKTVANAAGSTFLAASGFQVPSSGLSAAAIATLCGRVTAPVSLTLQVMMTDGTRVMFDDEDVMSHSALRICPIVPSGCDVQSHSALSQTAITTSKLHIYMD